MKGLFLFTLLALSLQVQAQHQNGEFRFNIYNDSWGGGFTPIYDDLRTYHFQAEYLKKNKLKLVGRYSLLSNRYDPDIQQRKLLDEVLVNGALPLIHFNDKKGGHIWLKAGVVATGDIIGSQIQKVAHRIFNVVQNELPYYPEKRIHPTVGYELEKNMLIRELKEGQVLRLALKHGLDHHHGYMTNIRLGLPLSLSTNNSRIKFTPGYTYSKSYLPDNRLLPRVLKAESGLSLGLKVFGRTLFYHLETFPLAGFSYGGIGIRLYKKEAISMERVDLLDLDIEVSVLNKGYGYNFKYSFKPFEALKRRTTIIVNHHYHTLLKRFIPQSPAINGHGNQITAGLEMQLLKARRTARMVEPYLNVSLGHKAIGIYSKSMDIDKQTSHHLAVNNDVGVNVQVPVKINSRATRLAFSFYHRFFILHSLTRGKESELVNRNYSPYANIQNALGLGVRFKI